MEEELPRQQKGGGEDLSGSSFAEEEFSAQEASYGNSLSLAEDDDYEHQEWTGGSSENCNLIVNYLPHEIDDVSLKTLFVEHGDIAVAKVVKDKISKKSLGYGFVKFVREEDAASAIELKNGFLMGHKKLKVSLARPPSTEIRNCKLFITNLPKEFAEREVNDLFSQFGEIIECRVLKDRNSKSNKGVAFVQFNLRIQASNALSLNGYRPPHCDRHLMVKYAEDQHKKKDRRGQVLGGPMGMSMMDNMGGGMMDGQKQDMRVPYLYSRSRMPPDNMYRPQQQPGPMQQINHMGHNSNANQQQQQQNYGSSLPSGYTTTRGPGKNMGPPSMLPATNSNTNASDWYGQIPQIVYDNQMVTQQSHQSMGQSMGYDQNAMSQQMSSHQQRPSQNQNQNQNQSPGTIYMRSPRLTNEPGYNGSVTLVIGFLPQHADVALLHDLCAPYGRIISAQIDVDPNQIADDSTVRGGCSGRGRVQMAGLSQAQYATQALNGAIIFEGGRPLQVSIAFNGGTRSMADPKKSITGVR